MPGAISFECRSWLHWCADRATKDRLAQHRGRKLPLSSMNLLRIHFSDSSLDQESMNRAYPALWQWRDHLLVGGTHLRVFEFGGLSLVCERATIRRTQDGLFFISVLWSLHLDR